MVRWSMAVLGLAFAAEATGAAVHDGQRVVIACDGQFRDQGLTTQENSIYGLDADGVQVWDAKDRQWIRYSCLGYCFANKRRVSVNDSYLTAERGYVYHLLELNVATGRLHEDWQVRDDVLSYVASCAPAADPDPAQVAVQPSTRRDHDLSVRSVAYGLPIPVQRKSYEFNLRGQQLEGGLFADLSKK